jgi:hypothetical protein
MLLCFEHQLLGYKIMDSFGPSRSYKYFFRIQLMKIIFADFLGDLPYERQSA